MPFNDSCRRATGRADGKSCLELRVVTIFDKEPTPWTDFFARSHLFLEILLHTTSAAGSMFRFVQVQRENWIWFRSAEVTLDTRGADNGGANIS